MNFIFFLKFNMDLYIREIPEDEKKEERIQYYNDALRQFGEIPDELYLFFHANEGGLAFLPQAYFYPYQEQFATTFDFSFMLKELSDHGRMIRNLLRFYFSELNDEEIERCVAERDAVFSQIKRSNYSQEEKGYLYEFFIDPATYIQTLHHELMKKEVLLNEYYKENYQKILDVYSQTTYELLCKYSDNNHEIQVPKNEDELYVSYCILNKYHYRFCAINDGYFYLLGYEFLATLEFASMLSSTFDIENFGQALAEETRVKILLYLLEEKETTCKTLERILDSTGSTIYHHVIILLRAGLLKTRNDQKTILYSINRSCFDTAIEVFKKFSNGKKRYLL
ncbi:MAG: helix-turn-helix transcriptional regulator [Clostridia bacterium]|nr:helix-turn-helix transcriptional regulator [Clostridia bacterium]